MGRIHTLTNFKTSFIVLLLLLFTITLASGAFAATDCWQYDNDQSACESNSDCRFYQDSWGSWCEEVGCWNFQTSAECGNSSTTINQSCSWESSSSGWCADLNCWSFDGTNQSACESNGKGLSCNWESACEGPWHLNCWEQSTESGCSAIAGCNWGICEQEGCWQHTSQTNCVANTGWNGDACKWNSQYSYCYESSCWDYSNKTGCEANSCTWRNGYCSEPYCGDYDRTNATACVNNSANLDCEYDGTYCMEKGCWNNYDQNSCSSDSSCFWETHDSGWCEEVGCWNFENSSWGAGVGLGTHAGCVNNSAGLECIWDSNGGWCYENITSQGCSDFTNLKDCQDTYYCLWNNTASSCEDPGSVATSFDAWNPGCYIFDSDQTSCESTSGCYWSNGCQSNSSVMIANELNCTLITESGMCNTIPVLDTCCTWQAGSCVADTFGNECREQLQEPPAGASYCEDYNAYTDSSLCSQIAGSPWFMPCQWNNVSERCEVKHDDLFTDGLENIMFLDNQQSCEFAGGAWVAESYCSGNIAVPTGHCEFKFDDEKNCDRACYACEYQKDGTNWSTSAEAKSACVGSALGICEYNEDSSAENGLGECEVKDEFNSGIAHGTCDTDCGTCTYMGDPTADTAELRPSYFCQDSEANCKWIADLTDPQDESKGRCADNSEKTCDDRCDRCYEQFLCTSYGAKKGDTSLAAQCTWDDQTSVCTPSTGAGELEICWDGVDNNNDNKIDCADSQCFSDPFCGGGVGTTLDCWSYNDETSCSSGGCDWVNNAWGSWCDMPGANCWEHDGTNQTFCQAQGCEWHSGNGGFCEDNWEAGESCFSMNQTACTTTGVALNCTWAQDSWCQDVGGWCQNDPDYTGAWKDCYGLYNQWGNEDPTGCAADSACEWQQDEWCQSQGANAGWCDHKQWSCWQYDHNQTACNENSDWCQWRNDQWGSYCDSKNNDLSHENSCWSQENESVCSGAGCQWVEGLCDPPGFGSDLGTSEGAAVVGSGMSCYVHDGNKTGCDATNGCGWFEESEPFCDVSFASECPQYSYNQTVCAANDRCYWNSQGGFCDEKAFNCWNNASLTNQASCDAHPHCAWNPQGSFCESLCFGLEAELGCNAQKVVKPDGSNYDTNLCNWIGGWCGGALSIEYFKEMEEGAPVILGVDASGDAGPSEADIQGHGMKDLGEAFGFGIQVADISGAAFCNGVKTEAGSGTGKNFLGALWYLDTDGSTTGSCTLLHDDSAAGYEFYLLYSSSYNNDTQTVNEQFSAYRCSNGNWTVADIKLTGFRQKMCSDINGPMVAVDKVDLEKFPSLYTAGTDLRITVATVNGTSTSTNITDSIAAGYATPGAVDFDLDSLDIYEYKSNGTGHFGQDQASKGFVEYKADCWTQNGCLDYSCLNHPYCVAQSYGVHASGFTDTRTPKVVAFTKEVYPDGALLSYFTDKPSNGTLHFYGTDSSCATLNDTIHDVGISNSNVRTYKLWHEGEIYNDGGTNSLNYNLLQDTNYYYKIKVCDENNKCGVSECSSFRTDKQSECGMCDFVTKIDVPSGWNVKYDLNTDGVYEHVQGAVCGANAGMYTNYTDGRSANIRLYKTDNSTWIDFDDVKLTKIGLSSKVRDVDSSSDFAAGTATDSSGDDVGYVGMVAATRDKIINNLHPVNCTIKIPGDGTCSELYHCSDDLNTCVDRTSEATLLTTASTYCEWQLPYCEFSVWAGGQPDSGSSGSGGSGGSGGGGGSGGSSGSVGASAGGGGISRAKAAEEVVTVPEPAAEDEVVVVPAPSPVPAIVDEPSEISEGISDISGFAIFGLENLGSSSVFWALFAGLVLVVLMVGLYQKLK